MQNTISSVIDSVSVKYKKFHLEKCVFLFFLWNFNLAKYLGISNFIQGFMKWSKNKNKVKIKKINKKKT